MLNHRLSKRYSRIFVCVFTVPGGRSEPPVPPLSIRQWAGPATEEMIRLVFDAGHASRYRLDPLVPDTAFATVYRDWIDRNCCSPDGTVVLVASLDNFPFAGLLSGSIRKDAAIIELLSVSDNCRRQRVARALVTRFERWAEGRGVQRFEVVTQEGNLSACRFYEACGFVEGEVERLHHIWVRSRGFSMRTSLLKEQSPGLISVVVPCYRSKATVEELCDRLLAVSVVPYGMEVVFVDDGSGDGTADVISELHERNPSDVTAVNFDEELRSTQRANVRVSERSW